MRYKAFILLICTLAFVTECVAMPVMMAMPPSAASQASMGSHTSCCSEATKDGAPSKCPKESKESSCCLDCPLCYTTIMPCTNEVDLVVRVFKNWYPGFQSSYAFGYTSDTWRPPNQA